MNITRFANPSMLPMKNPKSTFTLYRSLAACFCLGVSSVHATVLYDLNASKLVPDEEANTFGRGTATLSLGAAPTTMEFGLATNSYVVAYFESTTLAQTGDVMTFTLTYTSSSASAINAQDQGLRVGLFNSGANKVTANGATTDNAFNTLRGTAATLRARSGTVADTNSIYERTGNATNLWSSGAYAKMVEAPTLAQLSTAGSTIVYTIERLEEGALRYSISYDGVSLPQSFSSTSLSPVTYTFDTVSLFATPAADTSHVLSISEFTVAVIPEPGVSAMLFGLGALTLVAARRRRVR